jgi:DNA polymerase
MDAAPDRDALLALLDWYRAAGADAVVSDTPVDWLARGDAPPGHDFVWPDRAPPPSPTAPAPPLPAKEPPPRATGSPAPARPAATPLPPTAAAPPQRQFPTAAPDAAVAAARASAITARDLAALGEALAAFDGCALKATAKNLCFYRGAPRARLMIIGEAPGADEDREGRPFVGRAGQLLDKMLAAIGLAEKDVHITNVVYWRPPGNRTPTPQEAQACRPFLDRQVALVRPDIVMLLGGSAAKEVLGVSEGILRLRGKWREATFGANTVRALPTLHPAYLLRQPAAKRQAWRDLLAIKAALAELD